MEQIEAKRIERENVSRFIESVHLFETGFISLIPSLKYTAKVNALRNSLC